MKRIQLLNWKRNRYNTFSKSNPSRMKKLCDVSDTVKLSLIQTELKRQAIPFVVKNDFAPGMDVYFGNPEPQVWLVNDDDWQQAQTILLSLETVATTPWVCPQCHEKLEGQFNECWHCGYVREA